MKKLLLTIAIILALAVPATASFAISEDIPSLTVVFQGEKQVYSLQLKNNIDEEQTVNLGLQGDLGGFLNMTESATLAPGESQRVMLSIAPDNATIKRLYVGNIILKSDSARRKIPLGVRVVDSTNAHIRADIQATAEEIRPSNNITLVNVLSSNVDQNHNTTVNYEIRDSDTGETEYNTTREVDFKDIRSFKHTIQPGELDVGHYYVQAHVREGNRTFTSTDTFTVINPFWTPLRIRIGLFAVAMGVIIGGGLYTRKWYEDHKKEEARYVFPVDYSTLPEDGNDMFEVGKIAETQKEAYINPKDLTTHAIVAGSTGSGKSVTANVIAEEALENDIPVIVFDPTAQWTGFVKELKDDNILEHYDRFGMDPDTDPHPYPGVIKEIKSEDPDIDFQELKNPGEITVFTLNNLTTEQFDQAVRKIIDQIFEIEWEESPTLEMFIVFDEVHRLLEEYGGDGGYKALEKGAREFRKWGIGLMMCSQVTADFKQAISGNIMTEVQMQTKSMEDINRVEKKYGDQFAKRISSEDVGTGMIQNSNYNDGQPWFVDFRPTYHNPHKIPDKELKKYHELSEELDKLKNKLSEMEEKGEDIRDKQLELNLADNKLKEGRFKMSKMYIESLKDELGIS